MKTHKGKMNAMEKLRREKTENTLILKQKINKHGIFMLKNVFPQRL